MQHTIQVPCPLSTPNTKTEAKGVKARNLTAVSNQPSILDRKIIHLMFPFTHFFQDIQFSFFLNPPLRMLIDFREGGIEGERKREREKGREASVGKSPAWRSTVKDHWMTVSTCLSQAHFTKLQIQNVFKTPHNQAGSAPTAKHRRYKGLIWKSLTWPCVLQGNDPYFLNRVPGSECPRAMSSLR